MNCLVKLLHKSIAKLDLSVDYNTIKPRYTDLTQYLIFIYFSQAKLDCIDILHYKYNTGFLLVLDQMYIILAMQSVCYFIKVFKFK